MTKRALKMPDGGTFELAIPDGFGAPIFALNDSVVESSTKRAYLILGSVSACVAIFALWKALRK